MPAEKRYKVQGQPDTSSPPTASTTHCGPGQRPDDEQGKRSGLGPRRARPQGPEAAFTFTSNRSDDSYFYCSPRILAGELDAVPLLGQDVWSLKEPLSDRHQERSLTRPDKPDNCRAERNRTRGEKAERNACSSARDHKKNAVARARGVGRRSRRVGEDGKIFSAPGAPPP
ncbi:hypothetical protein SKAU_G00144550 [Synaphobranchus kaupii]|uniref:Uncharacterized protein n=1 Tax=Synaphobranchus kaupii TaxID=118154 RepID=A0A9Q1FTB4_SYNKA|nr:hypothetical protein SKAU_G00144550 [Synaphobranchus kaupii]